MRAMVAPLTLVAASLIQSVLVFLLGLLSAALVALAAGPALWRRAVRLTEKRVLASMPMTPNEIEAEKDRMRAAFAMEVRQIEMKLEAARARVAALLVELGRAEEKTRLKAVAVDANENEKSALARDLAAARDEAARLSAALHVANEAIGQSEAHVGRLEADKDALAALQEEAVLRAGSLQVELAEREGEIARLNNELRHYGESGASNSPPLGALQAAQTALRSEKRRTSELERKLAATTAQLAAAERRRETTKPKDRAAAQSGGPPPASANVLSLDNARIAAENAALREQVLDLAARVVAGAGVGPESPVAIALERRDGEGARPSGLADRIRALQKSASSGRN